MKNNSTKRLELSDISKYKGEIYGISILWIMLFHATAMLKLHYDFGLPILKPLDALIGYGNMGVETFLFCSGIFLYFSFYRNPDILSFIKKRLSRLFWPVVIITGLFWVYKYLVIKHDTSLFLSKLTMMDFWVSGDQQIWFVACILVCYLIYPYIYSYLFNSKFLNSFLRLVILLAMTALLTLVLRSTYPETYKNIEIALTRFPVFFIGCYFGKFVYEKKSLPKYFYAICFALVIFAFVILELKVFSGVWRRWFYMVGGIPLTFVIIWVLNFLKCKPLNKFFAFFGTISLNLYVSHIMVIKVYQMSPFVEHKRLLHYLVLMVIFVVIAYLAELLINLIIKGNKKKKVKPV
ncbi:MAG: acyltransferase [Ruminococcaceae bacterium]|nr:acyltransferase [Oscillospiraceae bacterium]